LFEGLEGVLMADELKKLTQLLPAALSKIYRYQQR